MILMMSKPGETHQPSYTFEIVVDIDPSTILQKKPSQDHVRLAVLNVSPQRQTYERVNENTTEMALD